jgi:nicotinamidase-related amidase
MAMNRANAVLVVLFGLIGGGFMATSMLVGAAAPNAGGVYELSLRRQQPGAEDRAFWRTIESPAAWKASETAVIVCDVWDLHHCRRAVERLEEFAPRIAKICDTVRAAGGTVIHAPSDCMPEYASHPARERVLDLVARNQPAGFEPPPAAKATWCSGIGAESLDEYPLDQSLGGEDDDPAEHAAWAAELERMGRNPKMPWKMQSPLVPIDATADFISDNGAEVTRVLAARGIRHVMLVGVHLNMCVLGRPFGLRRIGESGRDVVLVRDLTDTMYDPAQWPWVSHFTGTDRMIDHVERHVCPTISSAQVLGDGAPFRSPRDTRPTVALTIAEEEYGSHRTLSAFAHRHLGRSFQVVEHHVAADDPNSIPGLTRLADADVLLLSARRRGLRPAEMAALKAFLAAGKPVIGIRTASHAWEPKEAIDGRETWGEFDREVFGIEYSGHFGNELRSTMKVAAGAAGDPLLTGIPAEGAIEQTGSLYRIAATSPQTRVLAVGEVPGELAQPVLTDFIRPDGGRSIYTSIGHAEDLTKPEVVRVLVSAVHVAAGLEPPADLDERNPHDPALRWVSVRRNSGSFPSTESLLARFAPGEKPLWCRGVIVPDMIASHDGCFVFLRGDGLRAEGIRGWFEGRELTVRGIPGGVVVEVPPMLATPHRAGTLALEVIGNEAKRGWGKTKATLARRGTPAEIPLDRFQIRYGAGDGVNFRDMPLPAMFGGPADAVMILE